MKKFWFLSKFFKTWIDEYNNGSRYGLKGKILFEKQSNFQKITIVQTDKYGKALLLDDAWMTAEYEEKNYHECLVHPALTGSKNIERILIIGGGDGGAARECFRYEEVKNIDLVEIDKVVIDVSKNFLPSIGGNAWNDKRLKINITDGIAWVKNIKDTIYDLSLIHI